MCLFLLSLPQFHSSLLFFHELLQIPISSKRYEKTLNWKCSKPVVWISEICKFHDFGKVSQTSQMWQYFVDVAKLGRFSRFHEFDTISQFWPMSQIHRKCRRNSAQRTPQDSTNFANLIIFCEFGKTLQIPQTFANFANFCKFDKISRILQHFADSTTFC